MSGLSVHSADPASAVPATAASTTGMPEPAAATRGATAVANLLRGLTSAGVLLSANVHLALYFDGFSTIPTIGVAFMVNAVAGLLIGVALVVTAHPIPLLLAVGFSVATLAAFYISATVGLFGVHETFSGNQVVTAEIAEWVALLAAAGLLAWKRPWLRR